MNIEIDKVIALLIGQVASLRAESKIQKALINNLLKCLNPELAAEAERQLEGEFEKLYQSELEALCSLLEVHSQDFDDLLKSL